ncbi:MAG TPA: hypothetical protein VFN94_09265, partial [Nitrospiria bacterium]|nr:hypothetical protein [Nitrospiria bacterium]
MPHREAHITGEIFNHRLLWHTAESLAERGRENEEGSYHAFLASVLFAYFAMEALLNFLGSRLAPEVWAKEKEFFSTKPYRGT